MEDETEYLEHYGVLGMKWGIRRQRKKESRSLKRAAKMDKKISSANAEISEKRAQLQSENVRRLKSKARVSGAKNDLRQLGNKIKNDDYGLLFRKRKEKKAKAQLEDSKKEYKKALDKDLEIEANQNNLRRQIQEGKDLVKSYSDKKIKYIGDAEVARGKRALKEIDLQMYYLKKQQAGLRG